MKREVGVWSVDVGSFVFFVCVLGRRGGPRRGGEWCAVPFFSLLWVFFFDSFVAGTFFFLLFVFFLVFFRLEEGRGVEEC